MSYRAFFLVSSLALLATELVLIWRGADIVAIVAAPLLVGLTIQIAIRVVPGWQGELDRLRDPDLLEQQRQLRWAVLLLTALVIGLSVIAALFGYGLRHT